VCEPGKVRQVTLFKEKAQFPICLYLRSKQDIIRPHLDKIEGMTQDLYKHIIEISTRAANPLKACLNTTAGLFYNKKSKESEKKTALLKRCLAEETVEKDTLLLYQMITRFDQDKGFECTPGLEALVRVCQVACSKHPSTKLTTYFQQAYAFACEKNPTLQTIDILDKGLLDCPQ